MKNQIFAPFFRKKKGLFLENWQITGHKKKHKMITEQKNCLKPLFLQCENKLGPDNNPSLAQIITLQNPKLGPDNNFTAYAVELISWP